MDENYLICEQCEIMFDLTHKKPRLIPSCGHTVCSECIQDLIDDCKDGTIECEFDKI